MESTVCSSCGRGMSLRDLEGNTFREVEGKLYCPECLRKLGQPQKMRCPACGAQVQAVLVHGKYACPQCGKEIGGRQQSGVIPSARPAGVRDAKPAPAPPRPARTPRRRKNRSVAVLALALGFFIMTTLVLGALLIRTRMQLRQQARQIADLTAEKKGEAVAEVTAADRAALQRLRAWVKAHPGRFREAIEKYDTLVAMMKDPQVAAIARQDRDALQRDLRFAAERRRWQEADRKLRDRLQKAFDLIARLEAHRATKPAPATPAVPSKTPPETSGRTERPDPQERELEAQTAYQTALHEAQKRIREGKYGLAMAAMQEVADQYPDTKWKAQAEAERKRIRSDAYKRFSNLNDLARRSEKEGDYAAARALYEKIRAFGIPEIVRTATKALAELGEEARGKGTSVRGVSGPPPAAVRELVRKLKSEREGDRYDAARRLGERGHPAAIEPLRAALKDAAWSVRGAAARSLGQLGATSAVPDLIELLDDQWEVVQSYAHGALKVLTKQDFPPKDKARWLAWYERNRRKSAATPKPAADKWTFRASILERKYQPDRIKFSVPQGIPLGQGRSVQILKDGKRVCDVLIAKVENGEAHGAVKNLNAGARLLPGDRVTVRLPK